MIFVAQNFEITWAWQRIIDKTKISHGPLRLEKVMKYRQWVCYENYEWHFPLVTLFGLCVVCESIHLGLENHYKWYVHMCLTMLILVFYGAFGCLLYEKFTQRTLETHGKIMWELWCNEGLDLLGALLWWRICVWLKS